MDTPTKANHLQFIDFCLSKGLVNSHTGGGLKAACNKILEEYGPDDDLSKIDVPSEVVRYNNRHPGALSPDTLGQYQKRVQLVMAEFAKYRDSPITYKGMGRGTIPNGKATEKRKTEAKAANEAPPSLPPMEHAPPPVRHPVTSAVTETSLALPFPLRPTFLAQIVIPRDLTKEEAGRLCTFIQALAQEPTT
jgi:hypothetical protein